MDPPATDQCSIRTQSLELGGLTKALDDERADVCCKEQSRAPLRLDDRYVFAASKPDRPSEHHVYRSGEEQRAD